MQKTFCDICGAHASDKNEVSIKLDGKLLCDKRAKIFVSMTFTFIDHSSGYGGPPDLCKTCLSKILTNLKNKYDRIE